MKNTRNILKRERGESLTLHNSIQFNTIWKYEKNKDKREYKTIQMRTINKLIKTHI